MRPHRPLELPLQEAGRAVQHEPEALHGMHPRVGRRDDTHADYKGSYRLGKGPAPTILAPAAAWAPGDARRRPPEAPQGGHDARAPHAQPPLPGRREPVPARRPLGARHRVDAGASASRSPAALRAAGAGWSLNGRDAGGSPRRRVARGRGAGPSRLAVRRHRPRPRSRRRGRLRGRGSARIDILVNNAGIQHRAPLEDFPADDFERLLQTNVASVFHVGQACARHMIARGARQDRQHLLGPGELARPSIAPYTATQGRGRRLTKGMATDWARHGLA